jgi:hypothetical protein
MDQFHAIGWQIDRLFQITTGEDNVPTALNPREGRKKTNIRRGTGNNAARLGSVLPPPDIAANFGDQSISFAVA